MAKKSKAKTLDFNNVKVISWDPDIDKNQDVVSTLRRLKYYHDIYPHVSVMPDYHIAGSAINGSIIPSRHTLYLNAVGGDIGCGIALVKLSCDAQKIEDLKDVLYKLICSYVPTGRRTNSKPNSRVDSNIVFKYESPVFSNSVISKAKQQLGTVGDGNHFVEVQRNSNGESFLMVHSGSRYLGQVIKEVHTKNSTAITDRGPFVLEADSDDGRQYISDVELAIQYATENRREILHRTLEALSQEFSELTEAEVALLLENVIDIPHNFVRLEKHYNEELYIHRKGAICVPEGEYGIIAGTMGTPSYLVVGRKSKASFNSASHGAGRAMSRSEAFNKISYNKYLKYMEDIACRKDSSVLDEAPEAYKSISQVMKLQKDLVKRVEELHPIINIRG